MSTSMRNRGSRDVSRTKDDTGETIVDHLVPRAPDDDKHVGSAGRVKKRHHVPLSKGYFEGYNLKAQEDPLVEMFPVGLRRKRLACVIALTVIAAIMTLITLGLSIWILDELAFDEYGPDSFQVTSCQVLFRQDMTVDGVATVGATSDGFAFLMPQSGQSVTVDVENRATLRSLNAYRKRDREVSLTPGEIFVNTSALSVGREGALFVGVTEEEFSIATASLTVKAAQMTLDAPAVLRTPAIRALAEQDLTVTSDSFATLSGSRDTVLASARGGVKADAQSVSINPATDGDTLSPLRLASTTSDVVLDLSRLPMPKTTAASYAVCTCNNGRLFMMPGSVACTPFLAEYDADPCVAN